MCFFLEALSGKERGDIESGGSCLKFFIEVLKGEKDT
jgi:hypothetical protein